MKRALLIAGGTVGGLGAVLAITPPQLTSSGSINIAGGAAMGSTGTSTTAAASSSTSTSTKAVATAAATKSSKPVATKKATASASKAADPTPAASATPAATKTTATAAATTTAAASSSQGVTGTFTGPAVFVNYGTVQVKITVTNGRITDAVAVQAPSGRNDRYTQMAVPILKQQTLAAQSANINGVSGASYTSYGWYTSLVSALAKAGM